MSAEIPSTRVDWGQAIPSGLVEALQRNIASASHWVQLAHHLKDIGALPEAETAYRTAMRCDGTEWDPKLHLAHLLKRLDRLPEALELFRAIQSLPDGPNVAQEIAGLEVALLPQNTVIARPSSPPGVSVHRDALQALLKDLFADLASAGIVDPVIQAPMPAAASPARVPSGMLSCVTDLHAELVPKANLVIREGVFIGTTDNPQFEIRCGQSCHPGWIEIDIGIEMDAPLIEPVLYVEHAPQWQTFSTLRLAERDGRFMAVGLITGPILSLRLDPSDTAGAFAISGFSLKQIRLGRAIRHAWRRDRAATRRALSPRRETLAASLDYALSEILVNPPLDPYQTWIRRFETPARLALDDARRNAMRWPKKPALAVLVTFDPDSGALLEDTLASLADQAYPQWTLDIVSPREATTREREAATAVVPDAAFHVRLETAAMGRQGCHIVHIDAGDRMSPLALFRLAAEIFARRGLGTDVIYPDEDHLIQGQRSQPLFKPDWDPDFQASSGYLGSFIAIKQDRVLDAFAALKNPAHEPKWMDVMAAALSLTAPSAVLHIPEVLNHRHLAPEATAAVPRAVTVPAEGWPHVTLIIPTRDSADLLRPGIASLLEKTDYPSFDIIIVDNGSTQPDTKAYFAEIFADARVRVLDAPGPFNFSRLNNLAAAAATGSVLGLVNNDVVAIQPEWLKAMVAEAARPEIGAVGAKLVYPSGHVQHAGMALGVGFITAHPQKFRAGSEPGYMGTLRTKRRVSAVTAACLIVERRKFHEVGGLDDVHLQIAFNDVDFCLKLSAAGYHNLFVPGATLIHLESATRGLDMTGEKAARFAQEAEVVIKRWGNQITADPYYNLNLTKDREDCSIID
jgi:GT2 family glycosyltransferase